MIALQILVEPEELVRTYLDVFSPADEARLLDELRARRHRLADEIADAVDDAIAQLEWRAARYRWTAAEIAGGRAA